MKKIGLVIGVFTILALLSGIALADCKSDCQATWATCLKHCSEASCHKSCYRGYDGCLSRCKGKEESYLPKESPVQLAEINCVCAECGKKCGTGHKTWCSSYQKPKAKPDIASGILALNINTVLGASCIEKDLQCTLNGTPCCAPYECKGTFPNTYCKEK
jgi:hypothetical protein